MFTYRFIRSLRGVLPFVLLCLLGAFAAAQDTDLQKRLVDKNGIRTDFWVYNDLETARAQARRENKPLFVTFRCVPCKACASFDAEVAVGSDRVRQLAQKSFISVRQVEMKGVDLSLFQFDHDLNWAAVFIHPDGVVYGRYGTQSAEGPDAYNSIDGLLSTMNRVLKLHADYPQVRKSLAGKHGKKRAFKTALEMPGIQNPRKLAQQTTRKNCIHCHNIHDAENMHAQDSGKFTFDLLWRYPLPDQVGLKIDRKSGIRIAQVVKNTAAAKIRLQPGEDIVRMASQPITSIADMQWVLHHLPNTDTLLTVEGSKSGTHTLRLSKGWKKNDVSWRGSMWSVSPRLRVWTPEVEAKRRKQLGIDDDSMALLVKWINRGQKGGQSAFASGLREGDVIVQLGGKTTRMTPQGFNMHIKLTYKVGDRMPLVVIRGKQRREIQILLSE